MAADTRSNLTTLVNTNLPNNTGRLITPTLHRDVLYEFLDSFYNVQDDTIDNGLTVTGAAPYTIRLGGDLKVNTAIGLNDTISDYNFKFTRDNPDVDFLVLNGVGSWSLGSGAVPAAIGDVVVGELAGTTSGTINTDFIAIGSGAGSGTSDIGANSILIGVNASATASGSVAIGQASVSVGTAIGQNSEVTTSNISGTAVGQNAKVKANGAVSIGGGAGNTSGTFGASSVQIGLGANSGALNIGSSSVAIGPNAITSVADAVAIGSAAQSTGSSAISVGPGAQSTAGNGISIGLNARATVTGVIGIGNGAVNTGGTVSARSVTVGFQANSDSAVTSTNVGLESSTFGYQCVSNSNYSGSFGSQVSAGASGAFVIGSSLGSTRVVNSTSNSIGFGWNEATPSFLYSKAGVLLVKSLPTYADDTAAGVGGVNTDEIYKTATGELRIKL